MVSRLAAGAIIAAASVGCVGRNDNRSTIPADRTTGAAIVQSGPQTTVVGCLQKSDRDGTYRLIATADAPDRAGRSQSPAATSGRAAPAGSSTTGVGGDAIANSPTIGGGALPHTYRVDAAGAAAASLDQQVGAQVAVAGVIEDRATATGGSDTIPEAHVIRAASVTRLADRCQTH
jgi:hypothetical protein